MEPSTKTVTNKLTNQLTFALYQTKFCPYCMLARRAIAKIALDIELRDINLNPEFRHELIAGGGMPQVPCLRIENAAGDVRWLYESLDIIRYLEDYAANQR